MTWFPTVGQRIDESPNGWTEAGGVRPHMSPFLEQEGLTMEDWNFAKADAIPDPLHDGPGPAPLAVFGFGQGTVGQARVRLASRLRQKPIFDIVFFTCSGATLADTTHWAYGVYRNALWLTDGQAKKVRQSAAWQAVRARREAQLLALYPNDPDILRRYHKYDELKWRVAVGDVLPLKKRIEVEPPGYSLRFTNALNWSTKEWWQWLNLTGPSIP